MKLDTQNIRISVVVPAYNVEKYIVRSVSSILNQTIQPFEIIVVDDGSTDNTANLIKEFGEKVTYYFKENGGECSARNFGVKKAKGEWIAWLDSDDEWISTHLENFINVIHKKSDLKWFGAPANSYDENTGRLIHQYKKHPDDQLISGIFFKDYLSALPPYAFFCADTFIIHKEVFEKVGLFDITKKTGGDIDMWFRIGLHFPEVGFSHEIAAKIYRRDTSVSFTTKKNFQTAFQRIIDCETLAKKLGESYLTRSEARLRYWLIKLLKSSVVKKDINALKSIKERYYKILPVKYKLIVSVLTLFPFLFKFMNFSK